MSTKHEPSYSTALIAHLPSRRRPLSGASCLLAVLALWGLILCSNTRPAVHFTFEPIPTTSYTLPTLPELHSTIEPGLIKKNVAAIVEDRPLEALVPLLLHFSSVLGPAWPIVLFTSQSNIPSSPALRRALDERRISITFLPPNVHISHHRDLSALLTTTWFWETLAPAEKVFLFQAESMLCANSPHTLEEFMDYDFVGAPIEHLVEVGGGFNGAMSLRNRTLIVEILRSKEDENKSQYSEASEVPMIEFEDLWLYQKMRGLPKSEDGQHRAKLPTAEVAKKFAVESLWYDRPFGFHRLGQWEEEKLTEVQRWCPELHLARKASLKTVHEVEWKDPRA